MTPTELAKKMLEWQEAQAKADLLKMDIEQAVLAIRKTQTVGNVRATYSAGRKSYAYDEAFGEALGKAGDLTMEALHLLAIRDEHRKVIYDYRAICEAAGIKDVPFTQSAPSVALKIVA